MARLLLLLLFFAGCDEVHKSDKPVSREEAIRLADQRLPLPPNASKVLFNLSGGTQDWDLFLSFQAPLSEIEESINTEIGRAAKIDEHTEAEAIDRILKKSQIGQGKSLTAVPLLTPRWWKPNDIKSGYFIGHHPNGPYFWVDTDSQRCFVFEHY